MPDTASSMDLTKAELSTNWPIVLGVFTCLMFSVGSLVLYSYGVFAPELMGAFGWSQMHLERVIDVCREIRDEVGMAKWPSTLRKAQNKKYSRARSA